MDTVNAEFCAKYPFSRRAKALLEKEQLRLDYDLLSMSLERIRNALAGKVPKPGAVRREDIIQEVASYAAARMMLGYMKNRYLTSRFAVAEAKRASSLLKSDSESESGAKDMEEIAAEFGVVTRQDKGKLFVSLPIFVKYSPRDVPYRLVNRNVSHGYVEVVPRERIRLVEEAVRKHVENIPLVKEAPEALRKAAEELKASLPKIELVKGPVTFKEGDNAPCMEKMLEQLRKHENLNHHARWALAVYLTNKGMDIEKIISLYSNLPDFSEKITRYQLEHIQKRGYTTPSCATLLSYGLCVAECGIRSPMNWKGYPRKATAAKESAG